MELKRYLNMIIRNLKLALCIVIVATISTAAVNMFMLPPVYESSSTVYVMKNDLGPTKQPLQYADIMVIKQLVKDYKVLLTSRMITNLVAESLGLSDEELGSLSRNISVSEQGDTNVMVVKVYNRNPKRAQNIADKLINLFVEKISDMSTSKNVDVTVIDKPELPTAPIKPRKAINIAIAFMSSIIGAMGIVFFKEYLDSTIKTKEDVERYLHLNVLAIIPEKDLK